MGGMNTAGEKKTVLYLLPPFEIISILMLLMCNFLFGNQFCVKVYICSFICHS